MTHARRALAAAAAAALALGACGENRATSTSTETTSPVTAAPPPPRQAAFAARVPVAVSEYRLVPARIRVDRPAVLEVSVRNTGAERHALAVEAPAGQARTKEIDPGTATTLEVRLARPGRYRWYCPVGDHARRGMRGTIAVARG